MSITIFVFTKTMTSVIHKKPGCKFILVSLLYFLGRDLVILPLFSNWITRLQSENTNQGIHFRTEKKFTVHNKHINSWTWFLISCCWYVHNCLIKSKFVWQIGLSFFSLCFLFQLAGIKSLGRLVKVRLFKAQTQGYI